MISKRKRVHRKNPTFWTPVLASALLLMSSLVASADQYDVTVRGSDAIFLAGRTDVIIPPPNEPWTFLARHGDSTPEEIQETYPTSVPISSEEVVTFSNAQGGINFFNGFGPPYYGPSGNGTSGSNLTSLDGISGYSGPEGPLAGVFLNSSMPPTGGPAPTTLDFTNGGIGIDFETLAPELGQIFYIGDGETTSGAIQRFVAPENATELFLGIPDGFNFDDQPGYYDDNDGSYQVSVNVVPIPPAVWLLGSGLIGLVGIRRKFKK